MNCDRYNTLLGSARLGPDTSEIHVNPAYVKIFSGRSIYMESISISLSTILNQHGQNLVSNCAS